jgi:hypothetical protein
MNPPWLTDDDFRQACTRMAEIDRQLTELGADEEYCQQYFQSGGGVCERVVGRHCLRHRACPTPLPAGKMCSQEYGETAAMLRQRVAETEAERRNLRRTWELLKEEQAALGFMADMAARQADLEARKTSVKNRINHLFKELRDLMGERLVLLTRYEPIDATVFHDRVSSLLVEKISLLERLKLGIPPAG